MYSTILVALDGSEYSNSGAQIALDMARASGAEVVVCHIYDAQIHRVRFQEMEPGLPRRYQEKASLGQLRKAHDSLMHEGFQGLSQGYMERFLAKAQNAGIVAGEASVAGRNYVRILELALDRMADIIVMGAHGIGTVGDGLLGSTALRVLRYAKCDVLLARHVPDDGGILVGVDGSEQAMAALHRAVAFGQMLGKPVQIAAAYDPGFHKEVFRAMARSLSAERQKAVGLARQEQLHEELIDTGLGTLYQTFLKRAHREADRIGIDTSTVLLQGKAYQALVGHAERVKVDFLVVGRHGWHQEKTSDIGSNAEALARRSKTNLLVAAPREGQAAFLQTEGPEVEWDAEPLARLEQIPVFIRSMVRRGIDDLTLAKGGTRVTLGTFLELTQRMGMSISE